MNYSKIVKHGPNQKYICLAVDPIRRIIANIDNLGILNTVFLDKSRIYQRETEPLSHISISNSYVIGFGENELHWWKLDVSKCKLNDYESSYYLNEDFRAPVRNITNWFRESDYNSREGCFMIDSKGSMFLVMIEDSGMAAIKVPLSSDKICHNNFQIRLLSYKKSVAKLLLFDYEQIIICEINITTKVPHKQVSISTNQVTVATNLGNRDRAIITMTTKWNNLDLSQANKQFTEIISDISIQFKGRLINITTQNGKIYTYSHTSTSFVEINHKFPYGPFPCQSIGKMLSGCMNKIRDTVMIFSGGLPEVTYRNVNSLTVAINGEPEICFTFQDPVIDFHILQSSAYPKLMEEIIVMTTCQLISLQYNGNEWKDHIFQPISSTFMTTVNLISDIINVTVNDNDDLKTSDLFCVNDSENCVHVCWCHGGLIDVLMDVDISTLMQIVFQENKNSEMKSTLWPPIQKCGNWLEPKPINSKYSIIDFQLNYNETTHCINLYIMIKCDELSEYIVCRFIINQLKINKNGFIREFNNDEMVTWKFPMYCLATNPISIDVIEQNQTMKSNCSNLKLLSIFKWNYKITGMISNLNNVHISDSYIILINNWYLNLYDTTNMVAEKYQLKYRTNSMKKKISSIMKPFKTLSNNTEEKDLNNTLSEKDQISIQMVVEYSEKMLKVIYVEGSTVLNMIRLCSNDDQEGGNNDNDEDEENAKKWKINKMKSRKLIKKEKDNNKLIHLSLIDFDEQRKSSLTSPDYSPSINGSHSSFKSSSNTSTLSRSFKSLSNISSMVFYVNQRKIKLLDSATFKSMAKFNLQTSSFTNNSNSIMIGQTSKPMKIENGKYICAIYLNNSDDILLMSVPQLNVLQIIYKHPLINQLDFNLISANQNYLIGYLNHQSESPNQYHTGYSQIVIQCNVPDKNEDNFHTVSFPIIKKN